MYFINVKCIVSELNGWPIYKENILWTYKTTLHSYDLKGTIDIFVFCVAFSPLLNLTSNNNLSKDCFLLVSRVNWVGIFWKFDLNHFLYDCLDTLGDCVFVPFTRRQLYLRNYFLSILHETLSLGLRFSIHTWFMTTLMISCCPIYD